MFLPMLALLVSTAAGGAQLPGLPLAFDAPSDQEWVLAAELSPDLVAAGAEPGWQLVAIDGAPFTSGAAARRAVARGPARNVRLHFLIPLEEPEFEEGDEAQEASADSETPPADVPTPPPGEGAADDASEGEDEAAPPEPEEVILVLQRAPLVRAEEVGILPWPEGFAPGTEPWRETRRGAPVLVHEDGVEWVLDIDTGALALADKGVRWERDLPEVFWALSGARWVIDGSDGLTEGDAGWALETLAGAARARSFQGSPGDHLFLPTPDGLEVYTVEWPRGTPDLPMCRSSIPESCLASGTQIIEQLDGRQGARQEATRQLTMACVEGIHRACTEALALQDSSLAERLRSCVDGDVASCNEVARERMDGHAVGADLLTTGLLEHSCDMESAGSLGERLRRLDQTGEGCVLLSQVYDAREMPDMALLNLDQACVLGRADACEEAASRRHQAFAARVVRECLDDEQPISSSCTDLGRLLLVEEVPASELDAFDTFSRGCSLGAVESCILLGDFVDRWGIENPRVIDAGDRLIESCEKGRQRSCLGAAHLLVRHEPRTESYAEALHLFNVACQNGLSEACVGGAQQRRIGKAKKLNAPGPEQMWQAACDQHNAQGCDGLGERYAKSGKTSIQAFEAWNKACSLGEPSACTSMGRLVDENHRVEWPQSEPASYYLTLGCDNGDPAGCYWLAEDSLPKKGAPSEADYLLLERSCEGEFGDGCAALADVHLERHTNFDYEIAARHLDTACSRGHFPSCKVLGTMYMRGKGVERDRERASELLERFRYNMPRKHLRLGVNAGLPTILGGEGELVLPIPIGPAISIGGTYSYIPYGGGLLMALEGRDIPPSAPNLASISLMARLYPNTQARGIYFAVAGHQVDAWGNDLNSPIQRQGWSVRVGTRADTGRGYTGLDIGLFQLGFIDLDDFDGKGETLIPLINTAFSFSAGLAL